MKKSDLAKYPLPDVPGCYFFHDAENKIIYVGKATSLKQRVRSYFDPKLIKTRGSKIVTMVENATSITYKETESALEALILEAKLIKDLQPYFNTKEKDDKSFYSVVITNEDFPRVLLLRTRDIEKSLTHKEIKYQFGPFLSGDSIKEGLKLIRRWFPYRDKCELNSGKKCFNAQIGLCPGVCDGSITKKEYAKHIQNIKLFFESKKRELEKSLHKDMMLHAKHLEFEEAEKIKRLLFALKHIKDISIIKDDIGSEEGIRIESYDAAHISGTSRVGVMVVSINGTADKSQYRKFKLTEGINNDTGAYVELLERRLKHTEWPLPNILVVDGGIGQKNTAETVIKNFGLTDITVIGVVKDERHKAKALLGKKSIIDKYKKEILRTNVEAHRFAIEYHKKLRSKSLKGK